MKWGAVFFDIDDTLIDRGAALARFCEKLRGSHPTLGVAKPDPQIFARALAWAECPPERALFVGDDPVRDIAGAARAGMVTAWLTHGRPYPDDLPPPDHLLPGLAALGALVP